MAVGQAYDLFWTLTLREVMNVLDGVVEHEKRNATQQRAVMYATAKLAAIAHHDPKSLPDADRFIGGKDAPKRFASDDEISTFFMVKAAKSKERKETP